MQQKIKPLLLTFLVIMQLPVNSLADAHLPTMDIHLGNITNDNVMDGSGETALGLTMLIAPESFHPDLSFYVDLWSWGTDLPNTEFSACLFCSVDDEVDVDVLVIGLGLSAVYPLETFQFYLQGGLSIQIIDYRLGGSILGFPGIAQEDSDSGIAVQYGFGVVYLTGNNSVGIHFRRFDVESSSDTFSVQDVDIGGDYAGLSFGWHF